jgi:hypothetical protein
MAMNALGRLNGFIRSIPPSFVTDTPLEFSAISEVAKSISDPSRTPEMRLRERMRMQLGALLFNGIPRVAYDFPMSLLESLLESNIDPLDIPSDVLQLPHKCIYIGAYTKNSNGFEFYMAEEIYGSEMRNILFIASDSTVIIPAISGETFRESISHVLEGVGFTTDKNSDYWERAIRGLGIMLNVALFLTGGDLTETVIPGKTRKRARNLAGWERTDAICGAVGGRFCSALRRWQNSQATESALCPHGSPRPHLRAGHWHLYWTGKGRSVPKVQFLHPCLVNADSIAPGVEIQRKVQ